MASANPANEFLRHSRRATPLIFWASLPFIIGAVVLAWMNPPSLEKSNETAALISLQLILVISTVLTWLVLAYLSYISIRRREPLLEITCKALAVPGLVLAFLAVVVGAVLAHQKNGIWWNWDGMTTFMLALAIMLFGQVALDSAQRKSSTGGAQSPLLFMLIATAVMPFILASIFWWNSVNGQLPDIEIYQSIISSVAFYLALIGVSLLITAITLMRARAILADISIEAQMQRLQREAVA